MNKTFPKANWFDIFLLLIGRRKRFCINGDSMSPCLKNGDEVLIKKPTNLKIGDVVLANHPFKKSVKILKRISEIDSNGKYFLIGDNPNESTDSRTFGAISLNEVLGKVEAKLNKIKK